MKQRSDEVQWGLRLDSEGTMWVAESWQRAIERKVELSKAGRDSVLMFRKAGGDWLID